MIVLQRKFKGRTVISEKEIDIDTTKVVNCPECDLPMRYSEGVSKDVYSCAGCNMALILHKAHPETFPPEIEDRRDPQVTEKSIIDALYSSR